MVFWLSLASVFIADQATKAWVRSHLPIGEPVPVIGDILQLVHWQNPGAAFGLFRGATTYLVLVAVACLGIALYLAPRFGAWHWTAPLSLGLLAGGAFGNLIDRLRYGAVIDFISLKYFPPIFNVADSAIVAGSIIMAVFLIAGGLTEG